MAQLIKLQDYISRYETDLNRYPAQYIRLKKQHWDRVKAAWEQGDLEIAEKQSEIEEVIEKPSVLGKLKSFFKREAIDLEEELEIASVPENPLDVLDFKMTAIPQTELELRQQFLDYLLHFQIRWASSTIAEKSFVDPSYYRDERLKHFLQRFPDHCLLFYEPIFILKKAPIEFEVLLVTPTDLWCLAFLEEKEDAAYIGSNEHFWTMKLMDEETKVLSPVMSVNRMGTIVKQLLRADDVDFPIHRVIVSRTGYIDYPDVPSDIQILDKRTYPEWFESIRQIRSPLKRMQMQAVKSLLDYCETNSFRRPEWEQE